MANKNTWNQRNSSTCYTAQLVYSSFFSFMRNFAVLSTMSKLIVGITSCLTLRQEAAGCSQQVDAFWAHLVLKITRNEKKKESKIQNSAGFVSFKSLNGQWLQDNN